MVVVTRGDFFLYFLIALKGPSRKGSGSTRILLATRVPGKSPSHIVGCGGGGLFQEEVG